MNDVEEESSPMAHLVQAVEKAQDAAKALDDLLAKAHQLSCGPGFGGYQLLMLDTLKQSRDVSQRLSWIASALQADHEVMP